MLSQDSSSWKENRWQPNKLPYCWLCADFILLNISYLSLQANNHGFMWVGWFSFVSHNSMRDLSGWDTYSSVSPAFQEVRTLVVNEIHLLIIKNKTKGFKSCLNSGEYNILNRDSAEPHLLHILLFYKFYILAAITETHYLNKAIILQLSREINFWNENNEKIFYK